MGVSVCRVPFCHRGPWGELVSCKKHTLYSRQAMQRQRDKKKAADTKQLERSVTRELFSYGFSGRYCEVIAERIISKVAAHFEKTRRRRAG